ncbi:MAG: ABC transporter substrate-binding protein, partial [Burkholderiales bacterium]
PERQAIIDRMVDIVRRDAPWIGGFHPVAYSLTHAWVRNGKPNSMARNSLKYLRVDAELRARLRREWNRPVLWPAGLLLLVLAACAVPAVVSYRRRERLAAKPA